MKEWFHAITIDAPVERVFSFATNPNKTSLWIDSVKEEVSDAFPPKLGTKYRNTSGNGSWDEYEVDELSINRLFTLAKNGSAYRVRYTFQAIDLNTTKLTYCEWVENGDLGTPFSVEYLQKFKELVENA